MKLNKRERKAEQLLAHYATCERLAKYLGNPNPDGKRISVALMKLERLASRVATCACNGEPFNAMDFPHDENAWPKFVEETRQAVAKIFGGVIPEGFFVNGDPRGYALKIDNENPDGKALIDAVGLTKDWGGYGILSPEITGN